MNQVKKFTVTIANSGTTSTSAYIEEYTPIRIDMPAAWTAANITFQVSPDDSDWYDVYDSDGSAVTVTSPDADYAVMLTPSSFAFVGEYVRLVSSASQGAERDIILWCREIA